MIAAEDISSGLSIPWIQNLRFGMLSAMGDEISYSRNVSSFGWVGHSFLMVRL
jgi:hypothetical protein